MVASTPFYRVRLISRVDSNYLHLVPRVYLLAKAMEIARNVSQGNPGCIVQVVEPDTSKVVKSL